MEVQPSTRSILQLQELSNKLTKKPATMPTNKIIPASVKKLLMRGTFCSSLESTKTNANRVLNNTKYAEIPCVEPKEELDDVVAAAVFVLLGFHTGTCRSL